MSEPAATTVATRPTIADILLAHGFVSEEEIAAALEVSDRTGQPLGQVLVEAGAITRLELASALAEQWSDPDASITLLPKPPQPSGLRRPAIASGAEPTANDAIYVGRLHDAVADLAHRVGEAEPLLAELERRVTRTISPETLEELEGRLTAFAEQLETTLARMTELEGALGATADQVEGVTEGVEQAFTSLRDGTGELAERLAVIASIAETAPTSGDLVELQSAVAELAARPLADVALGDRLAALTVAVDDLAGRPQSDPALARHLEELEQRLDRLAAREQVDTALPSRLEELVVRVDAQAALYDKVATELRGSIEAIWVPELDPELSGRVDELAGRLGELAGHVASLAAVTTSGDDGPAIEELREALEELGRRRAGDEETAARLAALATTVDEIAARPAGDPALAISLDQLGRRVEELAERAGADPDTAARLDELATTVAALQTIDVLTPLRADVDDLRARLDTDDATLSELQSAAAELAARPAGDPQLAVRFVSLAARVEELAAQTIVAAEAARDTTQVAELGATVTSLRGDLDAAVAGMAARLEALEHVPPPERSETTRDTAWEAEAARIAERLDALTARIDEGGSPADAAGAATERQDAQHPAVPVEPGGETEQELERLRMAIERMSLHLGEQERAIAEVMRSRGVAQRLDELEARIDDVAAGAGSGGASSVGDGAAAPGGSAIEVRALTRRLDTAEAALEAERDKLLTKLERIASSLDWRMRRLEAGDDPNA